MTLIVPAERLMALLERVESAIEADQFVELRFHATETLTPARPETGAAVAAASLLPPPPPPVVRAPIVTPSPRAPWWRTEQAYRRRGAWLEWQAPSAWKRWLAAVVWCWLAVQVAAWALR